MIDRELLDIVNSGEAWAFVGAGASAASGAPSWQDLLSVVLGGLPAGARQRVVADVSYLKAQKHHNMAAAFGRIAYFAGRKTLEGLVGAELEKHQSPNEVLNMLSRWPFAGYITTNYDLLLEQSLNTLDPGWITVGNTDEETSKLSAGARRIVWHLHGVLGRSDISKLILTDGDYDEVYLERGSAREQFRALLAQRRIVFVGFGMQDAEILRVMRLVGQQSSPARPAFAFLPSDSAGAAPGEGQKYNIRPVVYRAIAGSHDALVKLMGVYSSLILGRTLKFGQSQRPCPSYDPETTGLLIYNELCLAGRTLLPDSVLGLLLRARILSMVRFSAKCTLSVLVEDLLALTRQLRQQADASRSHDQITHEIAALAGDGFITVPAPLYPDSEIRLTSEGAEHVKRHAAQAAVLEEQFSSSIMARARRALPQDTAGASRIARSVETFLKDCIGHRSLGVALAVKSFSAEHQAYQLTALLQALPDVMEQLASPTEARELIGIVQEIFGKPTEPEATYIGVALQAKFGIHVMGLDPDTFRIRTSEIAGTVFLVDATTLIPLLARSSAGHEAAALLIDKISHLGSTLVTTPSLCEEVAEHARWASRHCDHGTGALGIAALRIVLGQAGPQESLQNVNPRNEFLDGFVAERGVGAVPDDFGEYLAQILDSPRRIGKCSPADVSTCLARRGVHCKPLMEWEGSEELDWAERDTLSRGIAKKRYARRSYTHPRQTDAEAEALIIIRELRSRRFKLAGTPANNAFFISHTQVIDEVAGGGPPITMHPELALQWATTIRPCAPAELSGLTDSLFSCLHEAGLAVLDPASLNRAFHQLISASKTRRTEELERHRTLIAVRYGKNELEAFDRMDDLEKPLAVETYARHVTAQLEKLLADEKKQRKTAEQKASLSGKERVHYERLKDEKEQKKARARAKRHKARRKK